MRKITQNEIEKIKKIQIQILNVVDKFCCDNHISYWINCGTLLGAVRHKGYIPWDDDIDIGMLREDYNRFMNEFNKESKEYLFESVETNPKSFFPYGKVFDLSTLLFEPDEKGIQSHIYIDVFVYDNAPDSKLKTGVLYWKRNLFQLFRCFCFRNYPPTGSFPKRYLEMLLRKIAKLKPAEWYAQKIVENAKSFSGKKTNRVGDFTGTLRIHSHKSIFSGFTRMEFEGKSYSVPTGYDEWLKDFYGDYMKLPPVESRVSHHKFVAYINDDCSVT